MSIESTSNSSDVVDNPNRQLGNVGVISSYQDEYLPLMLNELRRMALLLHIISEIPTTTESVLDSYGHITLVEDPIAAIVAANRFL